MSYCPYCGESITPSDLRDNQCPNCGAYLDTEPLATTPPPQPSQPSTTYTPPPPPPARGKNGYGLEAGRCRPPQEEAPLWWL